MAPRKRKPRSYPSFSDLSPPSSNDKVVDIEVDMAESLMAPYGDVRPRQFRNRFEESIFVFTVMLAQSSTTFLQGVVVINTATIGKSLHMTSSQITWISAAIALSSGSLMVLFGKTADIFGRKIQLLAGMGLLSIFSLATAFASSGIPLDILCGFLGLGTAVIAPPAIGTLFATYPEGLRRNRVMGWLGVGNPVGFVLGSFSSGITSKVWSWRASFITISIFFFVLTCLAIWTMPSITRSSNSPRSLRHFDWPGALLTVVGMALVTAALTEGSDLGWNSYKVILMLILGVACLAGFGFWENYFRNPLINPDVWKNKNFALCILCVFFGYMSFITNQFWLCLYMQDVQHFGPLLIATRLLPQAIVGVLWSYAGQWLVSRISGTWVMGIGAGSYLLGAILCYFIRESSSYWTFLFVELLITVVGADFQFIVANLYISQQMPTQSSLAAGVLQTAMRLSIAVGLGITSAIFWAASQTSRGKFDATYPYERAFLCSIGFTIAGVCFVPFLRIGKQGEKVLLSQPVETAEVEDRPRSAAEYSDQDFNRRVSSATHYTIRHKSSDASIWSAATVGSIDSYFPRWSWETSWPDDRVKYSSGVNPVRYEVCIKCLEERRVIVPGGPNSSFNPYLGPHGWITQPNDISEPHRIRSASSIPRDSDIMELATEWPRSSYSEEFHDFQEHEDLHAYHDHGLRQGTRIQQVQHDTLVPQRQLNYRIKSRNDNRESEVATQVGNSKSDHESDTTYYSFDGVEAAKSAADLRRQHARGSQGNKNELGGSNDDTKTKPVLQLNPDDSKDSLKPQLTEGRNLLGHRRGRHAFDHHGKDQSLGGDTLHEVGIDFPSRGSSRELKPDTNNRSVMKSKGRFPIRVDKEVKLAGPNKPGNSQETPPPSLNLRKYAQSPNHQFMANGELEKSSAQSLNEEPIMRTGKSYRYAKESQAMVSNFSYHDEFHRDESDHSHPSSQTLSDSQAVQLTNHLPRTSISNSQQSRGSIIEIRLGSEVRRSDGSDRSRFSFAPSIEIPPKSPLRNPSSDRSQNSVSDVQLDEIHRSQSSHSKTTLEIPHGLLQMKDHNEAFQNIAEIKSGEANVMDLDNTVCDRPHIPPRRSSLLVDISILSTELDEKHPIIKVPRSASQTSKQSHAPTLGVSQSSDTRGSCKTSPSRLYYDGVKEEKLGSDNWV